MDSKSLIVAPSLLSADPLNLEAAIRKVEGYGADWLHIDVMDGLFVPNLTLGLHFLPAMKAASTLPLDVHLMITNPDQVASEYAAAGATLVTFHIEASTHPHRTIQSIQKAGAKAGIAINPGTAITAIEPLLPYIDLVNVMSVNPGFGGQSYISRTENRVQKIHSMILNEGLENRVVIEVDGGINLDTAKRVIAQGARVLVAGNFVFSPTAFENPIAELKKLEI